MFLNQMRVSEDYISHLFSGIFVRVALARIGNHSLRNAKFIFLLLFMFSVLVEIYVF